MLYLLDANILIDANRDYYPIDRVPEYWAWIIDKAASGRVKIPFEIIGELQKGKDELADFIKDNKQDLLLDEGVDGGLVRTIMEEGYAPDLTDIEINRVGKDPFLIAYALINPDARAIVTSETSKPTVTRHKRKLPDVAEDFGVKTYNAFAFIKALDFKTNWNR